MNLRFLAGAAAGYILGSRAGRERYDQIQEFVSRLRGSSSTQSADSSGLVSPPVIVGPAPDGATGTANTDVVLPDLESSSAGDLPVAGTDAARRLDPPTGG